MCVKQLFIMHENLEFLFWAEVKQLSYMCRRIVNVRQTDFL